MITNDDAPLTVIPRAGQHWLRNPELLRQLADAADIQPDDHVVDAGAGVGWLTRMLRPAASLRCIDIDPRLASVLRARVPHADVITGDARWLMPAMCWDVGYLNLTHSVSAQLLPRLLRLPGWRVIVATSAPDAELPPHAEEICCAGGTDYFPAQAGVTRYIRVHGTGGEP